MTVDDELDYIRQRLDKPEILCQLAEEASELAQAALKLRRALDGKNPTPKSRHECIDNLNEEVSDVMVCLVAYEEDDFTAERVYVKLHRWAERLREKEGKLQCKELN